MLRDRKGRVQERHWNIHNTANPNK